MYAVDIHPPRISIVGVTDECIRPKAVFETQCTLRRVVMTVSGGRRQWHIEDNTSSGS